MKAEDMGINTDTGTHARTLTRLEGLMLEILGSHIGADSKIPAPSLAMQFYQRLFGRQLSYGEIQENIERWKRNVRCMVNHLIIDHDQPVLSKAGSYGGYWIAESREEVEDFYETFRKRAMTGLTKASRGKKAVMADIVKQLAFEFEDLKAAERPAIVSPWEGYESAPLTVMTAFLDKMTREPEKFSNELRILRDKFGKILMPKHTFMEIQELSRKLAGMLEKVS